MNTLFTIKPENHPALLKHTLPWLHELQQKNHQHFVTQGLPTCDNEEWKYTDVSVLRKQDFALALPEKTTVNGFNQYLLPDCYHLVFINGHYQSQLMSNADLPEGVIVTNLATALVKYPDLVKNFLVSNQHSGAFDALNIALLMDGAFVYVPDNITLLKTIQILSVTKSAQSILIQPRHCIIAGENSRLSILESYCSIEDEIYFTNIVTQLQLKQQAKVSYYKYQQESHKAFHIAKTNIEQQADSWVDVYHFALGGELAREDLHIALNGAGATCAVQGLYWSQNQQHVDNHVRIDHNASHTTSQQTFKGIMQNKSTAVFNGKIVAQPKIKQINANLTNRNLLLDKTASVNTKPELEIYADDVKCSHGATVGQIDAAALFYLQARGIGKQDAVVILTLAFANEIIESIADLAVKSFVKTLLQQQLLLLMSVLS